jgi:hypothetical protein
MGIAHDKNGPALPGRTPDQSLRGLKLPDLDGSYVAVNSFCRIYDGSDLKFHYRAPLLLPRFYFRGERNLCEENNDCLRNGARLLEVRTAETDGHICTNLRYLTRFVPLYTVDSEQKDRPTLPLQPNIIN